MKKSTFAAITVLAAACGNTTSTPDAFDPGMISPTDSIALIVAGDYGPGDPGTLGVLDVTKMTMTTHAAPQGAVGDDPVVRYFDNQLYIVNRSDSDNVTILDGQTHSLVAQVSTGTGSNPQDVAVVDGFVFVPVFNGSGLVFFKSGSTHLDTVDLSMDDPDGKPNCNSIIASRGLLYVSCELLDNTNVNLPPRGPGKVYVVDPNTTMVLASVTMMNENPLGIFEQLPSGDVAIPTTTGFGADGECIEMISTGATPASDGCLVTNAALGGFAAGMSLQSLPTGQLLLWIVVSNYPNASLISYDLGTNMLAAAPISAASEIIESVAACPDGSVVVTDNATATGGVRVYKNAAEITTAPLSVGTATDNANAIVCY